VADRLVSNIPLLVHKVFEFTTTTSADIKIKNGQLRRLLRSASKTILPTWIVQRNYKMGFPVPLNGWIQSDLKDFFCGSLKQVDVFEKVC
jgi:hypothetical protein